MRWAQRVGQIEVSQYLLAGCISGDQQVQREGGDRCPRMGKEGRRSVRRMSQCAGYSSKVSLEAMIGFGSGRLGWRTLSRSGRDGGLSPDLSVQSVSLLCLTLSRKYRCQRGDVYDVGRGRGEGG